MTLTLPTFTPTMPVEPPSHDVEEVFDRQTRIFHPLTHRPTLGAIGLIGAGAIGSAMALTLVKMGIPDFTVFDPDVVEIHNSPNQLLYPVEAAGHPKVDAAWEAIGQLTGEIPEFNRLARYAEPIDARRFDTLILATDSLEARRLFWDAARQSDGRPERFLDLRMGGLVAVCWAAQRNQEGAWPEKFVATYSPTVDGSVPADDDPCGARSFLPTAMLAASLGGFTLAAWGRGGSVPFGTYLSFECSEEPFQILHQ